MFPNRLLLEKWKEEKEGRVRGGERENIYRVPGSPGTPGTRAPPPE